jgi:hypothetical protein
MKSYGGPAQIEPDPQFVTFQRPCRCPANTVKHTVERRVRRRRFPLRGERNAGSGHKES